MKQKYLRAKDVSLPTDVNVTFCYKSKTANVKVHSDKCAEDSNFLKPYINGSIRLN